MLVKLQLLWYNLAGGGCWSIELVLFPKFIEGVAVIVKGVVDCDAEGIHDILIGGVKDVVLVGVDAFWKFLVFGGYKAVEHLLGNNLTLFFIFIRRLDRWCLIAKN